MPEISDALYRAGEGEPVVLLHGATATWKIWRPVLADLVARYEVIAPTLAGHDGGPPYPDDAAATIAGAADVAEQQLDELGVGTAHFVGNSLGGGLSIEMAKRGRARSVAALSPAGGWEQGSPEGIRIARLFVRMVKLARAASPRLPMVMSRSKARQLALRDVMRRGDLMAPADAVDMSRSAGRFALLDQLVDALRSGHGALPQDLGSVDAPVLLAWAEQDRMLPASTCSSRYRREIPGAEFRLLPGVGHLPTWDDTRLVTETIVDWVDRHSASAT